MSFFKRIPKLLRWVFTVALCLLLVMTVFRIIFYSSYNPAGKAFSGSAFVLGLRFDARAAAIAALIILALCSLPVLNPFKRNGAVKFWNIALPFLLVILVLFYAADFYHFDYLHQRLNASVLGYLQDGAISYKMIWQTYPLLKITIGIILIAIAARFFFGWLINLYLYADNINKRKGILYYVVAVFILAQVIVGKIVLKPGQFPLRWSDAFTLTDDFKAQLALNPMQSFISTLSFRNSGYNINRVKEYYPLMAQHFGVTKFDSTQLNFERNFSFADTSGKKTNVVLVICESFSAYKSSMYNNPLNTTPYFNELCKKGYFFDRCFTPAYGTARGVWATITGIPDVENPKTASRNPNAVNQHTIINDFKGYEKFYFLGGSANWANIRGLLTNNIGNLNLYEEGSYKASTIDVWGISDKNLFLEANAVLKKQDKPFFAIIQTADNHRPYTIPKEDEGAFKKIFYTEDSLKKYGFENNDEMNAFRYTDFCFEQFMKAAEKETYFNNTIFVFIGDHGIRHGGSVLTNVPAAYSLQGITSEHVPLLFYAPQLINPKREHNVCSQTDVLPSIAGLLKQPHRNNTMGVNLFDTINPLLQYKGMLPKENLAFIIDHGTNTAGIINNNYYFLKNLKTGTEEIISIVNNNKVEKNAATDSVKNNLRNYTNAYYETAKYLLLNNKKLQ